MIFSIFIYLSLLLFCLLFGRIVSEKKLVLNKEYWILAQPPLLLISLVLGYRENVGLDFGIYKEAYLCKDFHFEPLFSFVNYILSICGASYSQMFAVFIFIQFFFVYKIFLRFPFLLFWGIFFLFTTGMLFSQLNIIRQSTALYIYMFAVKFVCEKKVGKYIIYSLFAALFHYSILLLLPCYFVRYLVLDNKYIKYIQLCLFFVVIFYGSSFFSAILELLQILFSETKYINYAHSLGEWTMDLKSGYGLLFMRGVDVLLIYCACKLSFYYNKFDFYIYFYIYYIGLLLSAVFGLDMVLSRIVYPFISFRFLVLSFFYYYVFNEWKKLSNFLKFFAILFMVGFIGMFLISIINGAEKCSPFNFSFL